MEEVDSVCILDGVEGEKEVIWEEGWKRGRGEIIDGGEGSCISKKLLLTFFSASLEEHPLKQFMLESAASLCSLFIFSPTLLYNLKSYICCIPLLAFHSVKSSLMFAKSII